MKKSGLRTSMEDWSNLISSIYEAAILPETWTDVLASIGRPINCHVTHLLDISEHSATSLTHSTQGNVAEALSDFKNEVDLGIHPRKNFAITQPSMTFFSEEHFVDEKDMRLHPYYNGDGSGVAHELYYSACALLSNQGGRLSSCSSFRPKRFGPITEQERNYYKMLAPHIHRSLELMQFNRISQLTNEILPKLDEFSTGIIVLNSLGEVAGINKKATTILNRKDGIYELDKKIVLCDANAQGLLNKSIKQLTTKHEFKFQPTPEYIKIERNNSLLPYQIIVSPLTRKEDRIVGLTGLACIIDPDEKPIDIQLLYKKKYGLTPAEAELLLALHEGLSLNEFAELHNISRETPRFHLKNIFSKTDTNRQQQLLLKLCADVNAEKFRSGHGDH